mgnify:CR=1 FL=1
MSNSTQATTGFVDQFSANIRAAGLSPGKTVAGFVLAWALFFYVAYGMTPPAGMSDRKSTRLNSSHVSESRMPSSA